MSITLYDFPLSGHAHRVRLALSLLNLPYEAVEVDLMKGAHKTPEFIKISPFGQVPVLDDDGITLFDSNAILVYLATKYDTSGQWLPISPEGQAKVQAWLSVAAGQIAFGPCAARLVARFGAKFNAEEVIARSYALLKVMDAQLAKRAFLVGQTPTLADIAGYSYIAAAPEGNVDLSGYPNVGAWLGRIEALPGFVPFVDSTTLGRRSPHDHHDL